MSVTRLHLSHPGPGVFPARHPEPGVFPGVSLPVGRQGSHRIALFVTLLCRSAPRNNA